MSTSASRLGRQSRNICSSLFFAVCITVNKALIDWTCLQPLQSRFPKRKKDYVDVTLLRKVQTCWVFLHLRHKARSNLPTLVVVLYPAVWESACWRCSEATFFFLSLLKAVWLLWPLLHHIIISSFLVSKHNWNLTLYAFSFKCWLDRVGFCIK